MVDCIRRESNYSDLSHCFVDFKADILDLAPHVVVFNQM